jgi:DNA-directed RNA polymerase specialized sigma subunit
MSRRGKRTFTIDVAAIESLAIHNNFIHGAKHSWFGDVLRSIYFLCEAQGNPRSELIEQETKTVEEQIRIVARAWLKHALLELPKNQELCIFHRYRFDGSVDERRPLRTETEIADIIGVSQSTVCRHLQAGLKNLRKSYNTELAARIKDIKTQFYGE